ncbi:MAG: hypothetical protein KDC92_17340, partial [Bacteroidetes bacterium]|nr:hypothetical protein [Bacteroidota bacterium]
MKKATLSLLAFILLFAGSASAQITIDSVHMPVIGDSIERGLTRKIDSLFNPTIKALGVTFDCSWLDDTSDLSLTYFSDPSSHPDQSQFPTANIMQIEDTIDIFCKKDKDGYVGIGVAYAGVSNGAFNPQPIFMKTPFNYQDQYNSHGYVKASVPNIVDVVLDLKRDVEVVNYGNVKMPDTMLYEVLVAKVIEIFEFEYTLGGNTTKERDSAIYYEFYCQEFPLPLLRARMNDTAVVSVEFVFLGHPITVGKEKIAKNDVDVYPNPTTSNFNITTSVMGQLNVYS